MFQKVPDEYLKKYLKKIPKKRHACITELTAVVDCSFLISDKAMEYYKQNISAP